MQASGMHLLLLLLLVVVGLMLGSKRSVVNQHRK